MQLNEQNKKDLVEIWDSAKSKELAVKNVQKYFVDQFNEEPSRSTIYRLVNKLGGKINKKTSAIKL